MTPAARILVLLVRGYQLFLSPLLGRNCRFEPTCSEYARVAVERFGARRGVLLALRRLLRCGPWNPGGYDPVPERTGPDGEMREERRSSEEGR